MTTWIDRKDEMDTSGGRLRGPPEPRPMKRKVEKMYSVSEVAELLSVSRQTVFKWLSFDDPENAVIPPEAWAKTPGGHIRIREGIVLKLQAGEV